MGTTDAAAVQARRWPPGRRLAGCRRIGSKPRTFRGTCSLTARADAHRRRREDRACGARPRCSRRSERRRAQGDPVRKTHAAAASRRPRSTRARSCGRPTPGSRPAGGWRLYPQLRPRVECANGESMACASGISLLVRVVDIALSRGTRRGPAGSSPPDGVGHEARGRAEAMSGAQSPGARWGAGHCQRVPGPAAHPPQAEWLAAPRNAGRDGDGRPQWFRRACDRPQG
jgi:hypothetical protein